MRTRFQYHKMSLFKHTRAYTHTPRTRHFYYSSLYETLNVFYFWDKVSFCIPNCLGTHNVKQARLKLTEIHLPLSLLGTRQVQGSLRGPNENTKGIFVLCSCLGAVLTRFILEQGPWPWRSEGCSLWEPNSSSLNGVWLSVLRQLCLRYPVFSLSALLT